MKYFTFAAVCFCLAVFVHAGDMKLGSSYGGPPMPPYGYNNNFGGNVGGGFGNAASHGQMSNGFFGNSATTTPTHSPTTSDTENLPCPKNYLFSCQPSLQPAPCTPNHLRSMGSVGAFSENYPVYSLQVPQYVHGYQAY